MSATKMIFRVWNDKARDPIAFILGYQCNPGRVMSYEHVGQHGEADYGLCLTRTRPATRSERAPLVRELQQLYGPIRIIRRMPSWRAAR